MTRAALYFAIFLDMVGFSMILPDVQTRLEARGANGLTIGLILSSYFLVQTLVSPLWGRFSDRVGRKPVLLVCGGLSALSLLVYGLSADPVWVLASRVLAGFAAANIVAAQAYLTDTLPHNAQNEAERQERTALLGRMGAFITAGLVLGPALGGWLAFLGGNRLLGFAAAGASALGALWIAVAVPPAAPRQEHETEADASAAKRRILFFDVSLFAVAPKLHPLLILAASAYFALACLEGTFGRLIKHKLGLGPREFGFIFGYEALVAVGAQTFLLTYLRTRTTPRRLLAGAYLLQGIGLFLTPFAPGLFALFGLSTLYATGSGIAGPVLNALGSDETPPERQGELFGLMQSARSIGFLIGPTLGGVLFDWRREAPYLLAGGVLLAAAASQAVRQRPTKREILQ